MSGQNEVRAAVLQARTRDAVDELRNIRCSDPAAAGALDAVRLAIHTLEQWWLPEIARSLSESVRQKVSDTTSVVSDTGA